jgi:hypothetical protein
LRAKFPAANVISSTFDAFFAVANQPEVKKLLPVITSEIEDGWIYGVASVFGTGFELEDVNGALSL